MDISLLHGQTLDLSDSSTNVLKITDGDSCFTLKQDTSAVSSIFRPIVSNELTRTVGVGPAFKSVVQAVLSINMNEVPKMENIPVTAYGTVPQLSNLGVRSMPQGSSSTLKELQKRQKTSRKASAISESSSSSSKGSSNSHHSTHHKSTSKATKETKSVEAEPSAHKHKKNKKSKQ